MQEQTMKEMRCHICTGCGSCFEGRDDTVVVANGGLVQYWQRQIREKQITADFHLIAVDIGTTTIAMVRYDEKGEERDRFVAMNPQIKYGADIISRIQEAQDRSKASEMRGSVIAVLEEGIRHFCNNCGAFETGRGVLFSQGDQGKRARMMIAGNTTMLYLLLGYDTEELGRAPFRATHLKKVHTEIAGIETIIMPGLSAFVGADILAGIYASEMTEQEKTTLLIDLGTNGEMAIGNQDKLIACSTAAGPAFEGGATSGIWGADMISLTARLLREGALDETGLLADPYFEGGIRIGNVEISEQHIRQLQLAKAAIAAGIESLLTLMEISSLEKIDRVVLAGGFGYYLKAEDAVCIGLLPGGLLGKVESAGNTSLAGILRYGFFGEGQETLASISAKTQIVNLADVPRFQERFIEAMYLREWEKSL